MEAVPRMPMLSFELKQSPESVEFGPNLKQYIRDHYGEDPAHYNKSCNELEQLRQSAVHVSHDFMGCSMLKKYYAQLQFLQGRFRMSEGGEAAMPFTWEDVHSGREVTHNDIKFEQACILYNIGSLHSLLGAMDTRQSADGMKVSCTHFQCAAGAYEQLRDNYPSSAMSLDMSRELLTFQSNLMLAQAQECILEKSMADSRKSTITAKVSAQIVEFYNTSLKSLIVCNSEELISSKQYKDWKKKIDLKVLFYTCITNYYMGQQSQEQQKWGQCLAYYTVSLNKLEECEKLAKNETTDVQDSLRFTHDVVGGKHQAAKKDNDFVYHEKVPDLESLPEVKGAPLVKGIAFNANDPEISGPDIFIKLVPMSAHEASSLYSEEKASLLRRMASEIAERDDELNKYLSSLQLDQTELNPEPERLPQQLLEKCAAISVRPNAIKDLVDSMTSVSNVATEVDMGIQEIQHMLQEESKAELEYQELFGKRAPNIILSEIAKECAKFEEGHRKGSQSNTDLHKAMNTHINNLKLLSSPLEDIQKLLPSVDKERGPESADVIKELNMLMSKVEEMRTQRQTLENSLRKEIMEDDITGTLAKQEGTNKDVVFAEQLKKHEKNCSLIRQNLAAQGNILRALTDANAKYANVRRSTRDTIIRRDQVIRDLINSYDIYEDLMAKSQKGLEFYKKLEANVQKLLSRCKGVCKVQQEEREQMMNRYKPKTQAPARPTANKPPVTSGIGQDSVLPSMTNVGMPSVTPMFDGPKLKDYLPFMKPNTFGKKAGSPDLSAADPAVQNYISKTGSLPNSGTASPVHMPNMSGSVPASPDHFRQSKYTPKLQGLNEGYPSLQDVQDGPIQGQTPHVQHYPSSMASQGQPQGEGYPRHSLQSQHQVPVNQRMGSPSRASQSPSPRQPVQYGAPTLHDLDPNLVDQSQFRSTVTGVDDQYVPLNEKWKREAQSRSRIPGPKPLSGQGQIPNQQGQNIGRGGPMVQGYAPQGPASQPINPVSHPGQVYPSQTQQMNQPGAQVPTGDLSSSRYQQNMQYMGPNQQNMVYGQQPMVGYREVTNTVSTIDTPVISPNKDGQAQVNQYGQVIGGHRHLQGMMQSQNIPSTNQGVNTGTQQADETLANQQYWQQQFQQQQDRLSQSQRTFPHQMPPAGPGVLNQQNIPTSNVQGQPLPIQGHSQGLTGQGQGQLLNQQGQIHGQGQGQMNQQAQGLSNPNQYYSGQGSEGGQIQTGQGQGQIQIGQNQQFQNTITQQKNQPLQPNSLQAGFIQQPLQVNQPQAGSQQMIMPSQNHVPGQPSQGQTPQPVQHAQQYGQQVQPPALQQVSYPQPSQQQNIPPMPTQAPLANPQALGPVQHHASQPNTPQQFPPAPLSSQSMIGQQGITNEVPGASMYQNQPQQTALTQQTPHAVPQMQQQVPGQQFPQNQNFQQNLQVSTNQSQQQYQTGHIPQNQQGPHNQSTIQQYPKGSLQQPAHSVAQVTGYQQSINNQGSPQMGQAAQPTQNYSPQHRPAQSQTPVSGVNMTQMNTQQPLSGQHQTYPGQPQTSQQSQQYTHYQQPTVQQPQQLQQQPQQQSQLQQQQGMPMQTFQPAGQSQVGSQRQAVNQNFPQPMSGQQQFPGQQGLSHQPTQPVIQPSQPLTQQPSSQGLQTHQFQQAQPQQSFIQPQQGQGQIGQQYPTPVQPPNPVSSSGVPGSGQGQRFSVPGSLQNPNTQVQTFPVQGQNQLTANVQGQMMINQGQVQPPTGSVSVSKPQVPAPAYSETLVNRQATIQMLQGQQRFPLQGQNMGQGQPYAVQPAQPYPHSQSPAPGQQTQQTTMANTLNHPNAQAQQIRGQSPGIITGPVQGQGQNLHQVAQPNQFPGQQPPLQPQILKPTVLPQSQGQDKVQSQGHIQDKGHQKLVTPGSPAVTATGPSYQPSNAMTKPARQTSAIHSGPVDLSLDHQTSLDKGHGEGQPIPASRQLSTASSLDEILSSSPETRDRPDSVLAPKVLTAQEIQQQKEDQLKNSNLGVQSKDPYKDRTKLDKFVTEVEKFAKFIEGYEKPSCSGPTPLDSAFKELMEEQEKAGRKQTLAIARCYPMKNRDQDIMPFDDSRVLISSLKDDYINASWINDLSPSCPKFIATQWPLPVTLVDFWLAVYEQGVEVIAALSSEIETGKKFPVYVPEVKGETICHGPVQLTLQSVKKKPFWTERIIHLRHSETKSGRTLVHLHYSSWPVSGFPEKVSYLLQFITEVHSFYRQQRSLLKPIVVHCSNGVGRTGIFLLIYMGMMEVNHGQGIINISEVAGKMLWKRRNLLHKKDQLKYCYDAILYYAQDLLAKEGILIHKASFGDQLPKPGVKSQSWEPGEDILFGSMSFSNLQTNIAKLSTKSETSRLDQQLEKLKNGEKELKVEQSNNEMKSTTGTVLPDLVQLSPGRSIEVKSPETKMDEQNLKIHETSTKPMDELIADIEEKLEIIGTPTPVNVINTNLKDKIDSPYGSSKSSPVHSSHESSPSPQVMKKFDGSAPSSLTELQDPSTFTIGSGETHKKKKITKADFTGEKKKEEDIDPDDPLSSLDPFWTVKK